MNRKPVERMIAILELVKDENFYLGDYFEIPRTDFGRPVVITKAKINSCGSTACALGHAALDPWFIGRGLCVRDTIVTGDNGSIITALERIFGLPFAKLGELFGLVPRTTEFYGVAFDAVTPVMVIGKLQELLNLGK